MKLALLPAFGTYKVLRMGVVLYVIRICCKSAFFFSFLVWPCSCWYFGVSLLFVGVEGVGGEGGGLYRLISQFSYILFSSLV